MAIRRLKVHTDPQLVACKVSGEYKAQDDRKTVNQEVVKSLFKNFEQVYVELILRTTTRKLTPWPDWQPQEAAQK